MRLKLSKSHINDPEGKMRQSNSELDEICTKYEEAVLECVESFGFDAESFNYASERICKKRSLKKIVRLQSQYYKVAADLDPDLRKVHVRTTPIISTNNSNAKRSKRDLRQDKETLLKFSRVLLTSMIDSMYY